MKIATQSPAQQLLSSAFSQAFAGALTGKLGSAWEMHPIDALDTSAVRADLVLLRLAFSGTVEGACFVEFERGEAARLASLLPRSAEEGAAGFVEGSGAEEKWDGHAPAPAAEAASAGATASESTTAETTTAETTTAETTTAETDGAATAGNTARDDAERQAGPLSAALIDRLADLLRSAAGEFGRLLGTSPLLIEVSAVEARSSGATDTAMFALSPGGEGGFTILLHADPRLVEKVAAQSSEARARRASEPAGSSTGSQVEAAKHADGPIALDPLETAANLKLVMDVELNVTLRFGQRRLSLREVLDLSSGSVIELDRQVDEPVELLLDGKVIARGEAVVIDGFYGLRVTEVPRSTAYADAAGRAGVRR
ncbi:MAG TPA: flagellar motor switch protein FliN [Acidisarcina sp.]